MPGDSPLSPLLSPGQLELLAEHGEVRTAAEGDFLFRIGDKRYPFMAVLEGEAAILDGAGNEIARQGAGGFIAEINLLTGQTVFVDCVVTKPMRYIAVEREELKDLLFEDSALSDVLLTTFIARREALQSFGGIGLEIVGPHSSESTRRLVDFVRRNRLPFVWRDTDRDEEAAACTLLHGIPDEELPLVRLPGGPDLRDPSPAEVYLALASAESPPNDILPTNAVTEVTDTKVSWSGGQTNPPYPVTGTNFYPMAQNIVVIHEVE